MHPSYALSNLNYPSSQIFQRTLIYKYIYKKFSVCQGKFFRKEEKFDRYQSLLLTDSESLLNYRK